MAQKTLKNCKVRAINYDGTYQAMLDIMDFGVEVKRLLVSDAMPDLVVDTPLGFMLANTGDWVIKLPSGSVLVLKPDMAADIFEEGPDHED